MTRVEKKYIFSLIIFLFKQRKIIKPQADLQRIIFGIFARFGYWDYPLAEKSNIHIIIGKLRTCTQQAHEMQTSGTKLLKLARIGEDWRWPIYSKNREFFKKKISRKSSKNSSSNDFSDFPNSSWLLFCISCRF